jgi:hypothetical protein
MAAQWARRPLTLMGSEMAPRSARRSLALARVGEPESGLSRLLERNRRKG